MPERRSETVRLERLRQVEAELRRVDRLLKVARFSRQQNVVSALVQGQQTISTQLAPIVDPRERAIEQLPELCSSPVITSCRLHDFVRTPNWQQILILPMEKPQIAEFVEKYAPQAEAIVEEQWNAASSPRSLISNPFYLRLLTLAFQQERRPDGTLSDRFRQAKERRGRLLEVLIEVAVENEVRNKTGLKADEVMQRLGSLAYYMLERNIIGAIPQDAVQRLLGDHSTSILEIAQDVNLLNLQEGPPPSIYFNHQLFLEFLLAYHLKQKSKTEAGFEDGIALLAQRRDRWAETVKLLFEMVDEPERERLIRRFVDALQNSSTWDIATRVLSDIGHGVAPRLVPLLAHRDEQTRRGAVSVLGRINAVEYAGAIAALNTDLAWRVRRAVVEALVVLKQGDRLGAFDRDPQPLVLRSVFRGRLIMEPDPLNLILTEIEAPDNNRQKQMAWAMHDLFADLLKRLPDPSVLDLLVKLTKHANGEVKVLGYLMISQTPDTLRRRLKAELMHGVLEEDDAVINFIARKLVVTLLNTSDLEEIERQAEKVMGILSTTSDKKREQAALRAYWLLVEAREQVSPQAYFGALLSAQPTEIELLTQRLSKRGDSVALSVLTYLLGNSNSAPAALVALVSMGSNGVRYLLAALDDPLPEVRIGAAQFLKFCNLPHRHARRVRAVLRENKVYKHGIEIPNLGVASLQPTSKRELEYLSFVAGIFGPLFEILFSGAYWAVGRILGLQLPFTYWLQYSLYRTPASIAANSPFNSWLVSETGKLAFVLSSARPDAQFWLARGRLMRAIGKSDQARLALTESLALDPSLVSARYELALVERAQGNLNDAYSLLVAEQGRFLEKGSDLERLGKLLEIEHGASTLGQPGVANVQHVRLEVELRLWDEASGEVIRLLQQPAPPPDGGFLLYQCYAGLGKTRRALGAALINNAQAGEWPRVQEIEIDNLR